MHAARPRLRLVPGTQVPEGSPSTAADNQPPSWCAAVLAAFHGGSWFKDRAGGYRHDGATVAPSRDGGASLVVTTGGRLPAGV